MSRLSHGLQTLSSEISSTEDNPAPEKEQKDVLGQRLNTIVKENKEERQRRVQFKTTHDLVHIPESHDRVYNDLNEDNCSDLIEAFKARGKQDTAAIVRPAKNPPNDKVKYELCTGARRYWTSKHLGWDFLIEVRDLDDREVFELNDIENRARKDVNDYERGKRYLMALKDGLYPDQNQLKDRLGLSGGQVSKLLSLGKLPEEVVNAYPSKDDIKIRHGADFSPLLNSSKGRQMLIARANKILQQREKGKTFSGSQVFKMLLEEKTATDTGPLYEVKSKTGGVLGNLEKKGKNYVIKVSANPEDKPAETCAKLLEELRKAVAS